MATEGRQGVTMKRYIGQQTGAVAPLVAVLLVLIIVCVALVVDAGHMHNTRIQLQRAVDASALAGAAQLLGDTDEQTRAIGISQATAVENRVIGRNVSLADDGIVVEVGYWDTSDDAKLNQDLDPNTDERFALTPPEGQEVNAVRVSATTTVDHIFFFFRDSTDIHAKAIAVNEKINPVLPLAVISCIPPTGPQVGATDVCGIEHYFYESNTNTAGWTALTLGGSGGASATEILQLFGPEGRTLFNQIVSQLQAEAIDSGRAVPFDPTYAGCESNDGTNIDCGLNNPLNASGGGDFALVESGDPLTRYTALPNLITDDSDEIQAFKDILSQAEYDGAGGRIDHLLQDAAETDASYQARLQDLYEGTTNPYGDGRFQPDPVSGDDQFIIEDGGIYSANFDRVIDYAGYPPVEGTTGSMTTVMDALIEDIAADPDGKKDVEFKQSLTDEHQPFDQDNQATSSGLGDTLLFTIPVIFSPECPFNPNTANSTEFENQLHYVGLAKFLVTRIWKGQDCYATTTPVTLVGSPSCGTFEPPLISSQFACPVDNTHPPHAFEGLIRPPTAGDQSEGAFSTVYLVH